MQLAIWTTVYLLFRALAAASSAAIQAGEDSSSRSALLEPQWPVVVDGLASCTALLSERGIFATWSALQVELRSQMVVSWGYTARVAVLVACAVLGTNAACQTEGRMQQRGAHAPQGSCAAAGEGLGVCARSQQVGAPCVALSACMHAGAAR